MDAIAGGVLLGSMYLGMGVICGIMDADRINRFFAWMFFWPLVLLIRAIRSLWHELKDD